MFVPSFSLDRKSTTSTSLGSRVVASQIAIMFFYCGVMQVKTKVKIVQQKMLVIDNRWIDKMRLNSVTLMVKQDFDCWSKIPFLSLFGEIKIKL